MASPELHIKDCYYFEVPKLLWPSARKSIADFPAVWIKNDSQFQDWAADRLCKRLDGMGTKDLPPADNLKNEYQQWKHHGHENFGKPMSAFLMEKREDLRGRFSAWQRTAGKDGARTTFEEWLKQSSQGAEPYVWFARQMEDPKWAEKWQAACRSAADVDAFRRESQVNWAPQKIDAYNYHLHGKILIPQPFGELRNLYQAESGFCVSKFMIIEVLVGLVILLAFAWLGRRVLAGGVPQGRLWNFLESLLVFVRDEVARKAIHSHHAEESHGHGHGHGESGHGHSGHGEGGHGGSGHGHGQSNPHAEADKFVPILWTLFLFILGCNLAGMLPWLGSPTGSWSVTAAMAVVTFGTGFLCGSRRFGVLGYWANQVPSMGLPFALAVILVPMIFLIEVLGLAIKHTVLSVRLLANMVAGHLVLLAIMALAFSVQGAMSSSWTITAFFALLGATALSCLELFVALLQAYVFTFLSALFINAAINKH